uniref:Uncharacterized protein n=1 Tax=Anguilla anguilla TaxID=7936 RepID=A0A0E9VMU8_ANGAN
MGDGFWQFFGISVDRYGFVHSALKMHTFFLGLH